MKTLINIKADQEVKQNAQALADELGISLSALINAYLKHIIRTREVTLSTVPRITPDLEAVLTTIEKDITERKNITKGFTSAEDMDAHLDTL